MPENKAKKSDPTDIKVEELVKWHDEWRDSTKEHNEESMTDRRFVDGKQWTDKAEKEVRDRGQAPVVMNRIMPVIDSLIGHEIDNRVDITAEPRTPAHEDEVNAAEDAIQYVFDREKFDYTKTDIAEDLFVPGTGAAIVEVDPESLDIIIKRTPWEQFFYDPRSKRWDYKDAKYLGIWDWYDREELLEDPRYKKAKKVINEAINEASKEGDDEGGGALAGDRTSWVDSKRDRLKVVEIYWHVGKRWYLAHYIKTDYLIPPKPTGYLSDPSDKESDERPLRAAALKIGVEGDRRGVVRALRDPQMEINKRRSKSIFQISARDTVAESGAIPNPSTFQHERARPDGLAIVRQDALAEGRVVLGTGTEETMQQMQMLQEAKAEIQEIAPSTEPDVAIDASGRARQQATETGLLRVTGGLDRLRWLHLDIAEQVWHRIRQFKTSEWWVRVRDDESRSGWRFTQMNRQITKGEKFRELLDDGADTIAALNGARWDMASAKEIVTQTQQMVAQQMQQAQQAGIEVPPEAADQMVTQALMSSTEAQEPITENDVAQLDVDIVLDTTPNRATIQQEESAKMMDLIGTGRLDALGAEKLARLAIEASQLRAKPRLLELLDDTGQPDPNAAAIAELQQQMQQMQMALTQAQTQLTQAMAAESAADAQLSQAKAVKTAAEAETVEAEATATIQKNQAHAAKLAAEAGEKTVPEVDGFSGPV